MDLDLSGKVALITGGSKGIGRAIAKRLAQSGANIAICARGSTELEETSRAIASETKRECLAVQADLSSLEDCRKFVKAAADRYGRADVLVCSANVLSEKGGTFKSITDEEWVSHMDLKFFSTVRCAREVLPYMQQRKWGRVIIISGMATRLVRMRAMDNGPICGALANFGKQLSAQVVRDGIRVNTIHPDFTRTDLLMSFLKREADARKVPLEEVVDEMSQKMPIGRLIKPEEIAHLVAFLCTDLADPITGQSIAVDGGAAMSVHY
jgi:NAD(P)-dependent dehydrogenase (short-subunit alcohol dehydrogenase family)